MASTLELTFSGLTAVGTVGAVIISLWATLHHRKRFCISETRISRKIKTDKIEENYLVIVIDNFLDTRLEVKEVEIIFEQKKENRESIQSYNYEQEFIAPLSIGEIKCPLEAGWVYGSLRTASKIFCNVKTSLGTKKILLPKKNIRGLCDSLEIKPESKNER